MGNTEHIRILWTDSETGEEKEIFDFRTTLAGLWNINQMIQNEFKKATGSKEIEITAETLDTIERLKRSAIYLALLQNGGNKKQTAEKIGIQRTTLHEIVERLKITKDASTHIRLHSVYIQSLLGEVSKDLIRGEAVHVAQEIIKEQLRAIHGKVSNAVAGGNDLERIPE